jgi:acyl-CoA synthetase (AMP-forming)/AMP-acid ligase II
MTPTTRSGEFGAGIPFRMLCLLCAFWTLSKFTGYRNSAVQNTIDEIGTVFLALQYVKEADETARIKPVGGPHTAVQNRIPQSSLILCFRYDTISATEQLQVTRSMSRHPSVRRVPRENCQGVGMSEAVVAFIEPSQGAKIDLDRLRAWIKSKLSPYKVPLEIVVLERLPAAATGKVLKRELQQRAAASAVR